MERVLYVQQKFYSGPLNLSEHVTKLHDVLAFNFNDCSFTV